MQYKSDRRKEMEQATRDFLRRAKSSEAEIKTKCRIEASEWHKSLPKERRQMINTSYREGRLAGIITCSFADWLIEKFGN